MSDAPSQVEATMSTADYLTVEHQVLGLFDTLDRTAEPKDAAGYASERLAVHYDLDLLGLARRYPPSTPGTPEAREALLLEHLGAAAGMVGFEARVSVAVLDALIDLLTTALTTPPTATRERLPSATYGRPARSSSGSRRSSGGRNTSRSDQHAGVKLHHGVEAR